MQPLIDWNLRLVRMQNIHEAHSQLMAINSEQLLLCHGYIHSYQLSVVFLESYVFWISEAIVDFW